MQIIIFPQEGGGVSVMTPAPGFADQIEALAIRDVPDWEVWVESEASEENPEGGGYMMTARPWRIINSEELPPVEVRARWRWTESGPLTVAAPDLPPVPEVVSRFQARAALHIAGLLVQAEAAVAAADPLAQMAWADAQEFRRNSPTIAALSVAIGLTAEQVDDLFRSAVQIVA